VAGTVVDDGELRTYVTITSDGHETLVWYALDDEGGVSAAELDADPPSVVLGATPDADDTYRPDDPIGAGAAITVTFTADGHLTLHTPSAATTTATRSTP
jgi:hypothetical protein